MTRIGSMPKCLIRIGILLLSYIVLVLFYFHSKQSQQYYDQHKEQQINIPVQNQHHRQTKVEELVKEPVATTTSTITTTATIATISAINDVTIQQNRIDVTVPNNQSIIISQNNVENTSEKRKLQTILDRNFMETGSSYRIPLNSEDNDVWMSSNKEYLWNHSELIPSWMKEYFDWHTQQRKNVTESNWKDHRWLVMSCIDGKDGDCGGISDRLKPILYLIRHAYQMNRILIIYWSKPIELEQFLMPPLGGIDWRAPTWFRSILVQRRTSPPARVTVPGIERSYRYFRDTPILRTMYRSSTGEEDQYEKERNTRISRNKNATNTTNNTKNYTNFYSHDEDEGERSFKDIYHDVWRIFFTPTKPLVDIITKEMNRMGLTRGKYVASHFRALYYVMQLGMEKTEKKTRNALNCSSNLRPGGPILFSSELVSAVQAALDYNKVIRSKFNSTTRIVSRSQSTKPIFHFSKMEFGGVKNKTDPSEVKASDLYETFVDLYLLGMSSCLTYGDGGFGHLGLLIGYNASCGSKVRNSENYYWKEPLNTGTSVGIQFDLQKKKDKFDEVTLIPPLFLEPMRDYEDRNATV